MVGRIILIALAIVPLGGAERGLAAERTVTTPSHLPPTAWTSDTAHVLSLRVSVTSKRRFFVHLRPSSADSPYFAGFAEACRKVAGAVVAGPGSCKLPLVSGKAGLAETTVPAVMAQPPGLSYHIADAAGGPVFASASRPYTIQVRGRTDQHVLLDRLARHNGNANRLVLRTEFTFLGTSRQPDGTRGDQFSEFYGGGELQYTHRTFGYLYAFRLGINIMRATYGSHSGGQAIKTTTRVPAINAGYGEVDFELHEWFSVAARIIFGATQDAFTGGVGMLVRVGPMWSTHAEAGFDWIDSVGARGWFSFHWDTIPYLPMAFIIEVTEQPDTDEFDLAVRTMVEMTFEIHRHFDMTLRAGYAKRENSYKGGFVVGLGFGVEF